MTHYADIMEATLLNRLAEVSQTVFRRTDVLVAYAFGSRIHGKPLPQSDLDIGYYLRGFFEGKILPIREEMLLEADLSDGLGEQVDLRDLSAAPLELKGRVLEEGVRIYSCHDAERVSLECGILSRYHDYKEVFQRMHEERLRRLAASGN